MRIIGRTHGIHSMLRRLHPLFRRQNIGAPHEHLVDGHPHGQRQRVRYRLREERRAVEFGPELRIEGVQHLGICTPRRLELVLRIAQARLHLKQVALGYIPLAEAALHHTVQRLDDRDILLGRRHEYLHGGYIPVSIVGRITHVKHRRPLVAQGRTVVALGLARGGAHSAAV